MAWTRRYRSYSKASFAVHWCIAKACSDRSLRRVYPEGYLAAAAMEIQSQKSLQIVVLGSHSSIRDVIARFRRFPARDKALGWESTIEEVAMAQGAFVWALSKDLRNSTCDRRAPRNTTIRAFITPFSFWLSILSQTFVATLLRGQKEVNSQRPRVPKV